MTTGRINQVINVRLATNNMANNFFKKIASDETKWGRTGTHLEFNVSHGIFKLKHANYTTPKLIIHKNPLAGADLSSSPHTVRKQKKNTPIPKGCTFAREFASKSKFAKRRQQ